MTEKGHKRESRHDSSDDKKGKTKNLKPSESVSENLDFLKKMKNRKSADS